MTMKKEDFQNKQNQLNCMLNKTGNLWLNTIRIKGMRGMLEILPRHGVTLQ